jgi:hypothetical protein
MGDVEETDCGKGTNHDSTNQVDTSADYLLETSTLMSVATRGLYLKSFPLGIHLLTLIIHHNRAIHKRLKIGIGIGHQLQL